MLWIPEVEPVAGTRGSPDSVFCGVSANFVQNKSPICNFAPIKRQVADTVSPAADSAQLPSKAHADTLALDDVVKVKQICSLL